MVYQSNAAILSGSASGGNLLDAFEIINVTSNRVTDNI